MRGLNIEFQLPPVLSFIEFRRKETNFLLEELRCLSCMNLSAVPLGPLEGVEDRVERVDCMVSFFILRKEAHNQCIERAYVSRANGKYFELMNV